MTTGRPRSFDPDRALEQAMACFWRQGYEATSLADLLEATGLSKSSLYSAFGGKQALFERCLERYREQIAEGLEAALAESPSAIDFLRELFHGVAQETRGRHARRGCLVVNTANEIGPRTPGIAREVARGTRRFEALFRRAVERAQAEGDIDPKRDAATLARYLTTAMAGLRTQLRAGASAGELHAIADVILDGLSSRDTRHHA